MNVTQRNYAMNRVAQLYRNKFEELYALNNTLLAQRNEALKLTNAEVLAAFKANKVKFNPAPKLDDTCSNIHDIFDLTSLTEDAKVRADKIATLYTPANSKCDSYVYLTFPGYKNNNISHRHFIIQSVIDSAEALLASFNKSIDAIMLGDSAVAMVAVEKAELLQF